ncbi:MAG TPA: alpha/beta fold hydrolase, partial [Micromonosporaceae bacterium]
MSVTFRGSGDIALAADVAGDWGGPPVLLLHGGGQTRHSWGGTTSQLAEAGFLVVSLDLRGHGDSEWEPAGDYAMSRFADDVRAVLADLGRPAALVGASLG